jgi:fluoride exporter
MELVLVGIGGALGSLTRFKLGKVISERITTTFPLGTFLINITGALLLGFISSLDINKNMYLFFADGFLGAYTTFSTFMYEGFNLFQENEKLNAFIYIAGSLFIGVIGYATGFELGKLIK